MASITELLDKLKNARATVELVDACGKRVCSGEEHWDCPYGNEGMTDCAVLLEAAYEDTIENLLQLAESLSADDVVPAVRWIPVTERLPEYAARVLVTDARSENNYVGIWTLEKDPDDDCDCWFDSGGWWSAFDEVTHWAPLPEPPEEG